MGLEGFFALVFRLTVGILAIQDPSRPVMADEALSWATAVAFHAEKNHLDPYEIVGIARNESDFRPALIGPDGKDCGITQTRVTFSRYRCRQLQNDPWIAFAEAARELTENQARCQRTAKGDLKRCRLNSYNSGIRYARSGFAGGYWLRVSCFAEAARRGVTPLADCRTVRDKSDVTRIIAQAETAQAVVAAAPAKSAPRPVAQAGFAPVKIR